MKRHLLLVGVAIVAFLLLLLLPKQVEPFIDRQLRIGLVAIFKNESMIIRERLEHYIWQGVDAFLLLDNNSTDNFQEKLEGLDADIKIVPAKKIHAQTEHYNNFALPWCKEKNIDILIVCDIDEYFFVRDGRLLSEYLREKFTGPSAPAEIYAHWTMFGSSGHEKQPPSIRKGFLWKRRALDSNMKSILFVPTIKKIEVHRHIVRGPSVCVNEDLQLNHYAIMSKEYYRTVKMTRGDVASSKYLGVRDWNYFKRYDHKEEQDTQLSNRLKSDDAPYDTLYSEGKKPADEPDRQSRENSEEDLGRIDGV